MIHGNLVQSRRLRALEEFNRKKNGVLVASPVAARGLDIKGVTHIFNYDLSKDAEEYVHRVGRTARAGESGIAVTLLSQRDYEVFSDIMNRYQLDVKEEPCPDFPRLHFDARRERRGGDRGGYGSRDGGRGDSRGGRGSGYRGGGRSTPRSGGRSYRPSSTRPALRLNGRPSTCSHRRSQPSTMRAAISALAWSTAMAAST